MESREWDKEMSESINLSLDSNTFRICWHKLIRYVKHKGLDDFVSLLSKVEEHSSLIKGLI